MRHTTLIIFGALLIVGSATHVVKASEHHARRGPPSDRSNYSATYKPLNEPLYEFRQTRNRPGIEELQKEQDLEWGCGWPYCESAGGG
jgi:hypothetical protein